MDAYVLYSSISPASSPGRHITPAVIEKLDSTWTKSTGEASKPFGPSDEGEILFQRGGTYYMLEGRHCCFCRGGTDLSVYTSKTSPLGEYPEHVHTGVHLCLLVAFAKRPTGGWLCPPRLPVARLAVDGSGVTLVGACAFSRRVAAHRCVIILLLMLTHARLYQRHHYH